MRIASSVCGLVGLFGTLVLELVLRPPALVVGGLLV